MEKKYVEGLFSNPRKENQPDFVLANISFSVERFAKWLSQNANDKGYVYFQILQGRDGGAYLKHNDWKPEFNNDALGSSEDTGGINIEDIPF